MIDSIIQVAEEVAKETKVYSQEEYDKALLDKEVVIAGLRQLNNEMRIDADKIAGALRNEADDRNWCEQYNTFVDEVNEGTKHLKLEPLARNYELTVTVSRVQTQTITVSIDAINDDVARDEFYSNAYDYAESELRDNNWSDDDVEYEIDEVYEG